MTEILAELRHAPINQATRQRLANLLDRLTSLPRWQRDGDDHQEVAEL
ncbi:hypothetical protein ACIBEF_29215 [Micromonospora sp. NPDC050795]